MKLTKILFTLFFATNIFIANSQLKVVKIEHGAKLPKEYVTYFLPRTSLWADVKTKTTISQPGRFANYAKRLLAIDKVITQKTERQTIESISLREIMVPDSSKYYAVEVNTRSVAYRISKNTNGIIQAINQNIPESHDTKEDTITTPINSIEFDYSFLSEDALKASTELKMAEITAQQILDIRNTRMDILTGDSEQEYDGEAMKLVLARLDEAEKRLTEFFSGKSIEIVQHKMVQIPLNASTNEDVLFRFSEQMGVLDKNDYTGSPIMFSVDAQFVYPLQAEKGNKGGIYYNNPGKATISISDMDKIWTKQTIIVPQFGYQKALPTNIFSRQTTTVIFNRYGGTESIK